MQTIHVVDFEGNKRIGISEFGIVTLENLEIVSVHRENCEHNFPNHLEYFLSLRRSGILAAHSAQTEDCLLRHHWASPGKVPTFVGGGATLSWGPWIDTKLIYKRLFRNIESYELADLIGEFFLRRELKNLSAAYCGPQFRSFHNALFDALAATLLILNLRKYFPELSPEALVEICHCDA
jgi:DNA polymerase III epsilon subunit-like protein